MEKKKQLIYFCILIINFKKLILKKKTEKIKILNYKGKNS